MATRRSARQAARRRSRRAHANQHKPLYRRALRYEPLEVRRLLALVTVNTPLDTIDLDDGLTSLREAIFATNLVRGPDEITFDFGHDGPETIVLTMGELLITDDLAISGPGAPLLTIDASGNDPTPALDNGDGSRVFKIDDGNSSTFIDVSLSGLTLTGGDVGGDGGAILTQEKTAISEVRITNNVAMAGGGIAALSSSLTLSNSQLCENFARTSTGSSGAVGGGGGIFALSAELTIFDTKFSGNRAANYGGAVRSSSSDTTIRDTVITANYAGLYGGGIYTLGGAIDVIRCDISDNFLHSNSGRGGAGLRVTNGTMNVIGSVVSFNHGGSGISASSSQLSIENTSITDNVARLIGGGGAGLNAYASTVSISDSSIARNHNSYGGGISTLYGTLDVERTSIHDNIATELGGAMFLNDGTVTMTDCTVFNNSARVGGGLTLGGNFAITSSTISNNTASSGNGAGIEFYPGKGIIRFSTITDNRGSGLYFEWAPTVELDHVIVAGNGPDGKEDLQAVRPDRLTLRSSLIGYTSTAGPAEAPLGSPDINGNLVGGPMNGLIDPRLGPLVKNGGPTMTHALLAGSPAINAGDLNAKAGEGGVPLYDQRGEPYARVVNGRIDIGAFEYQAASDVNLLVDTLDDESDGDHGRGDLSLREAIELANLYPSDDTIRFDPTLTANGPATIILTEGDLRINDDVSIEGPGTALLTIDATGNDPTPEIDDGRGSRVFNIASPTTRIDVSIFGLTITGGDISNSGGGGIRVTDANLVIADSAISGNSAFGLGAGIGLVRSTATILHSTISDNTDARAFGSSFASAINGLQTELMIVECRISNNDGAGIVSISAGDTRVVDSAITNNGSGIYITQSGRTTTITGTLVSGNDVRGGIYIKAANGGSTTITDSTVTNNTNLVDPPSQTAGGITVRSSAGSLTTITNSTVSGNTGLFAGGIFVVYGTVTISELLLSGNRSEHRSNSQGSGGIFIANVESGEISDCQISNNATFHRGGGISAITGGPMPGPIQINRCTITANTATEAGGVFAAGQVSIEECVITENSSDFRAGGVWIREKDASLVRSRITDNSTGRFGGGIYGADSALIDVTISGNTAGERGGGINARGMTIIGAAIYDNTGKNGGGVWLFGGRVENSTISGNSAVNGSGVFSQYNSHINHSTVAFNEASGIGGGILVASGSLALDHTIVARNSAPVTGLGSDITGLIGATFTARYSLIGSNIGSGLTPAPVGMPDANGNLIGGPIEAGGPINPRLGPLVANGGPTVTHALLPGSPAIDAGDPAAMAGVDGVPQYDQRGAPFTRVHGGRIDMGAFESQPIPLAGDYNFSGVVDAADVVVWRKTLGSTTDLRADGNGDGVVNQADWQIWRANFGRTAESGEQGPASGEPEAGGEEPAVVQASPQRPAWQPPASPGVSVASSRAAFRTLTQRFASDDDLLASLESPRASNHAPNDLVTARRPSMRDASADSADANIDAVDRVFETVGWAPPTINRPL